LALRPADASQKMHAPFSRSMATLGSGRGLRFFPGSKGGAGSGRNPLVNQAPDIRESQGLYKLTYIGIREDPILEPCVPRTHSGFGDVTSLAPVRHLQKRSLIKVLGAKNLDIFLHPIFFPLLKGRAS